MIGQRHISTHRSLNYRRGGVGMGKGVTEGAGDQRLNIKASE